MADSAAFGVTRNPQGLGADWDQAVNAGPLGTRKKVDRLK